MVFCFSDRELIDKKRNKDTYILYKKLLFSIFYNKWNISANIS